MADRLEKRVSGGETSEIMKAEEDIAHDEDVFAHGQTDFSTERVTLEKKLKRKLDARMSILIIIYILNYIDRNNASAAKSRGFVKDLNLDDTQYSTCLSILYVGYILMQVPSNAIVQLTGRPSIYLPICMTIWGLISILTGVTHNFIGALLTRFFLGFVEAAFFPGALFLLSKWYKKDELGVRYTMLYCGSLISGAFGPLMAAGILGNMEGKLGVRAWRWLFYIEGALTIAFAIISVFILPDFPHNTRGLSQAERDLAVLRIQEDSYGVKDTADGGEDAHSTWQGIKMALADPQVWLIAFSMASIVLGLSFNAFFPQISKTLGYGNTPTLLLCAPPFVFATIVSFANARHSDATHERYWHIVGPLLCGAVGFIISMATTNTAARYVAMFLMAGSYAGFVVCLTWITTSFPKPAMKRATAIAFVNAFGQLGNIAGSYIYRAPWAPKYLPTFAISLAAYAVGIAGWTVHLFIQKRKNARIIAAEEAGQPSGYVMGFRYPL
ncbi:hypothetical protein CI109_103950 [Kwoniella shandongensis]|uniref:Uncharacterized protein n=1 Tax=Kwoniella shandongensis TaxID=1734106 RepID=A0A5M6BVC2_9TREE|nr:uncharacterized protein CI109_005595 [Kwoniella shandongensis]KAA5526000.1 hypothetical protein CI109_005595 [Kwoniella shandongensis]